MGVAVRQKIYVFEKQYDPAGRMLSGTLPGGNSTFGYDAFGRLESIVHPSGSGNFQRDLLNRITQVTWTGATPISQAMGFDLAGNITQLERENTAASTIAYDAVDQVLSSVGGSTDVRSYTRDLLGNRLQDSVNGAGSFVSNFLASNGLAAYTADPNGFGETVQEVKAGVTKNYVYRADGLLSGFQSGSTQVASYYDALGRLAARAINDGVNNFTQSYAYLGAESTLLQAKAGDGTITSFLSGQGPNEYLAESKGGVYKGYLTDHAGSILNSELAGPAHRYSLHGEPTGSVSLSPTSSPAMLGWQGLRFNPESGNWDNLAREYNPSLGIFLSQDPIGYASGDLNYYRAMANNPVRFTDPLGLKTTVITTYDYGFGSHSAVLVETPGQPPFLYDPAGSYPGIGSGDVIEGVTLEQYLAYQISTGSRVDTAVLNTTPGQEAEIRDRAVGIGGTAGGFCAGAASGALGGVCGIEGSAFPGNLNNQAKKAKCP